MLKGCDGVEVLSARNGSPHSVEDETDLCRLNNYAGRLNSPPSTIQFERGKQQASRDWERGAGLQHWHKETAHRKPNDGCSRQSSWKTKSL